MQSEYRRYRQNQLNTDNILELALMHLFIDTIIDTMIVPLRVLVFSKI